MNKIKETVTYRYFNNISTGNITANKWIKLLAKQQLSNMEKSLDKDYPYFFCTKTAKFIEGFVKLFNFTSGVKAGQPLELSDFQLAIFQSTYCWKYKDNPKKRKHREVLLFISRKNGKSFITMLMAVIMMILEPEAECGSIAGSQNQAMISVRQCLNMIKGSTKVLKKFKVYAHKLGFPSQNSTFQAFSSEAKNADGKNLALCCLDESAIIPEALMHSVKSGSAMRLSPLFFNLSTSYDVNTQGNWFFNLVDYSKKILSGEIEDDSVLPFIYGLDSEEEVFDKDRWIKANPIIGDVPIVFDNLSIDFEKAQHDESLMRNFLIKNMNIIYNTSLKKDECYIEMHRWKNCVVDKIDFENKDIIVGFDGSMTTDLTAITVGYYEDGILKVKSVGILPEDSLITRKEKFNYRQSADLEECYITSGNIVNYLYLEEFIRGLEAKYNCRIKGIYADFYNAIPLLQSLARDFEVIEVKQSFTNLSPKIKEFRNMVYTDKIRYEKSNLFDFCMSNCKLRKNHREDVLLEKTSQSKGTRIDLVASTINIMTYILEQEDNAYENEGLFFV